MSGERPFLSIIIPALNEERRLPTAFEKIDAFLAQQPYTAEVLVVENGSSDDTVGVTKRFMAQRPYIRLFQEKARGKGLAVRRGMIEACGQYRFMCDVDLSMPIEEVNKFLPPRLDCCEVAIGSREAPGAVRYNEPEHRHLMGRVNNILVKLLVLPGFEDTQCGFKMFTAQAAEDIFPIQRINGIGFDVEALFIAKKRGYKIVEVPINWYYNADTRMRLVQDSLRMIREIFEVRRNWSQGLYERRSGV